MSNNLPSVTSPPWGTTTKRLVVLSVVVILCLVARQVSQGTWTSFILALVLAYLLTPVVIFFERRLTRIENDEQRRTLSVVLTWLLVFGFFALVIGLIVPVTIVQMRSLAVELPTLLNSTQNDLKAILNKPIHLGKMTFVPWDKLQEAFTKQNSQTSGGSASSTLQNWLVSLADSTPSIVGGAVTFVIDLFFVLVMLFYLMRDGPAFVNYLVETTPESYRGDVRRMLHELGLIWNAYVRGQFLLCLATGGSVFGVAVILGLPQPLLLGVIATFLELIPNLGSILALILAVLFSFTAPSATIPGLGGLPYTAIICLAYFGVYQLESLFLAPRILGHSLDLHPFVVIVSILIGASLAGLLGIILAAPSVATLRLFARYLRAKLLDEELFPALPAYVGQPHGFAYGLMHYFLARRFPLLVPENHEARQIVRVDSADQMQSR